MLVSIEGANQDRLDAGKEQFERTTRGWWNAHRSFWHSGKMQVKELTQKFSDMQLSQLRKDSQQVTNTTYRVSPEVMGIVENSNRATIGGAFFLYAMTVVEPRLEFMCAEFASAGSRIDNRCKAVLDDVALQMRQNPGATAMIVGHSDSRGSDDANATAAMERSENAKTYLMDTHGIDASRIAVEGRGSAEPMGDNDTAAGRSQNRRIEIVVTIPPR